MKTAQEWLELWVNGLTFVEAIQQAREEMRQECLAAGRNAAPQGNYAIFEFIKAIENK